MRKKDDWFEVENETEMTKTFDSTLEGSLNRDNTILTIVSVFMGYLLSTVVELPALIVAHFLRTLEWEFQEGLVSLVLTFLLAILVVFLYFIFAPLRKRISEQITNEYWFYSKIITTIFAFMIIDLFLIFAETISIFIIENQFVLDLGALIEQIISKIILLIAISTSYLVVKRKGK